MLGTIVNTGTILAGSMLGSVLRKGVKEKYQNALYTAMGLAATALGINAVVSNMPKSNYPVLFIVSLAVGSLLGTILDLMEDFRGWWESIPNPIWDKGFPPEFFFIVSVHSPYWGL